MTNQVCRQCKKELPFTLEFFPPDKDMPHGLRIVCRTCHNARMREYGKKWRLRIRIEVLTHYSKGSPRCSCCDENHVEFLSIDHVDGGGRKHRKEIKDQNIYVHLRAKGFPSGYRVLCHNCNMSLGLYGYCPHQAT